MVGSLAEADLHVVNSCTVTQTAARGSRKAGGPRARRSGGRADRAHRLLRHRSPEEAARLAGVDLVVPNAEKDRLLERVHAAFPEPSRLSTARSRFPASAARRPHPRPGQGGGRLQHALRLLHHPLDPRGAAQPSAGRGGRGGPGARSAAGYQEIVVTGVQISAWRCGGEPAVGAGPRDLLRESGRPPPAPHLDRALGSRRAPPRSCGPTPIARLCRHLHLSLQSGATATLRRMRRPYTARVYARLLDRVRAAIPGVAVTTDVIVGFPGETDAEFAESLAFVEAAGFAKVHVFPFSAASRHRGREPARTRSIPTENRERMERMLAAAERAERAIPARRTSASGRPCSGSSPRDGMGQGLTDNYLRVFSPEGAALWNRFSEVELVAATMATLRRDG